MDATVSGTARMEVILIKQNSCVLSFAQCFGKAMYSRTADSHEEKELDGYGNKNWFHRQNKVDISV